METRTADLAATIGSRVRHHRQARGWTLDRLAEAAGVSRRMLVNVEQGAVNPSVGSLLRLGDALGVGLPALVEPPRGRPVTVTRDGEGPVLWSSGAGGRAVLVAATEAPDVVELWEWTLAGGDRYASEAHSAGTRELVHVLEGTLVLEAAGEQVTLGAGDAASFPGDVAHAYAAPDGPPARFSLSVFEPGVGAGHRTEAGAARTAHGEEAGRA